MRWYNLYRHRTRCLGFPSKAQTHCADPCPQLFGFVLCCLAFSHFWDGCVEMWQSKIKSTRTSHKFIFTFIQDNGVIWLVPFAVVQTTMWDPDNITKFTMQCAENSYSEPLLIVPLSYEKNHKHKAFKRKQTSENNPIDKFPHTQRIKFSTLSHITIAVLSTQWIRTLVHAILKPRAGILPLELPDCNCGNPPQNATCNAPQNTKL